MIFEACVGNIGEALEAEKRGASRIELCDNLMEGGTTPSFGTIALAKEMIGIPFMVIIRPRGGDFCYSDEEFEVMKKDIELCKKLGVYGVVLGILDKENNIDIDRTKALIDMAKPMKVTFHMAFDEIHDKDSALEKLIELRVDRILTKGCKTKAFDGVEIIKRLVDKSKGRIEILPGGGVTKDNFMDLAEKTGVSEVHGTKIV